MQSFSE